jgi:hypothetical protein
MIGIGGAARALHDLRHESARESTPWNGRYEGVRLSGSRNSKQASHGNDHERHIPRAHTIKLSVKEEFEIPALARSQ